jgi:hypothetical protein
MSRREAAGLSGFRFGLLDKDLRSAALGDQLSAVFCPTLTHSVGPPGVRMADTIGDETHTQHARRAENPQGVLRRTVADRRHYTDSSGAFACRATAGASGVNPPE